MEFILGVMVWAVICWNWNNTMPFHGLLSEKMSDTLNRVDTREVLISWLPAWWFSLAVSFSMAGMGIGCAIWAIVNQFNEQPTATPFLLGCSAIIASFGGIIVPIVLAFFRDRSESRQIENMRDRIRELETQLVMTQQGQTENRIHLEKIADAAQKIVEAKEQNKSVPPK